MKKKYFTPELEEMTIEDLTLLVGSGECPEDETSIVPCADEGIAPPCDEDDEV